MAADMPKPFPMNGELPDPLAASQLSFSYGLL
jgi:hypothetical protein